MFFLIISACVLMTNMCVGMDTELTTVANEHHKLFYLPAQKMVPLDEYKQLVCKYDVNAWQAGDTPLMQLIRFGVDNSYIDALLNQKARINVRDGYKNTALHWAMNIHKMFVSKTYNPTQIVLELLIRKADPSIQNNDGDTPLHRLYKQPMTLFYNDEIDRSVVAMAITSFVFTKVWDSREDNNKELLTKIVTTKNNDGKTIEDLVTSHPQYTDLFALRSIGKTIKKYTKIATDEQ